MVPLNPVLLKCSLSVCLVSIETAGPAGEMWEVELPLANFRPWHPQLADSTEGLELTDVHVQTVKDAAGLESNWVELAQ